MTPCLSFIGIQLKKQRAWSEIHQIYTASSFHTKPSSSCEHIHWNRIATVQCERRMLNLGEHLRCERSFTPNQHRRRLAKSLAG